MPDGPHKNAPLYLNPGRYLDEVPGAHNVDVAVLEMIASDREEAEGRALEAEAELEKALDVLGDLVDAISDEVQMEASNSLPIKQAVRRALDLLPEPYHGYRDDWWLDVD